MIAVGTPVVAESTRRLYLTSGLIGAATFLYGLALGDSIRAWQSLLVNFLFFGGLAQAGVVISAGGRALIDIMPHLGVAVGVGLAILGGFLLVTRRYSGIMALSRIQGPSSIAGARGFFLFGLAYGTASLSCTLPIFLVVVVSVFDQGSFSASILRFVNYGLGMGFTLMVITMGVVFFRTAVSHGVRSVLPYVQPVGALALAFAGSYVVYYWTLGKGSVLLFS